MVVGCGGAIREAGSFLGGSHFDIHGFLAEGSWVIGLSALSIIGGVFALRGQNWARWLLLAWMGAHVLISLWHARFELVVHCLVFMAIMYALFRAPAEAYFRGARP